MRSQTLLGQAEGAGRRGRGFTLIELVVVIVIIGILAAIAWPGYTQYVQRARRADAKNSLMSAANRQEQFILDRGTYADDMEDLGYADDPAPSEEGHYLIAAAAGACGTITRCYTLTATPVAAADGGLQARDTHCATFSIASTGEKTATNDDCW